MHALNTDVRRNKIGKYYNFDLKDNIKKSEIDPNRNHMQHKLHGKQTVHTVGWWITLRISPWPKRTGTYS